MPLYRLEPNEKHAAWQENQEQQHGYFGCDYCGTLTDSLVKVSGPDPGTPRYSYHTGTEITEVEAIVVELSGERISYWEDSPIAQAARKGRKP